MPKSSLPYRRIMIKLSGEFLGDREGHGIDNDALLAVAKDILELHSRGIEVVLVNGGGNIWRFRDTQASGIERTTSDYMGMLATVMNSVALQSALEHLGVPCRVATALDLPQMAEPYIRRRVDRHLEKGRVVICAGGTGNPHFTTDTAAALRAVELKCQVLLKATKVDGIYSADPAKDKDAVRYERISFDEAMKKQLEVMDQTAFSLCRENRLPIVVFDHRQKGALLQAALGEPIGTLVS